MFEETEQGWERFLEEHQNQYKNWPSLWGISEKTIIICHLLFVLIIWALEVLQIKSRIIFLAEKELVRSEPWTNQRLILFHCVNIWINATIKALAYKDKTTNAYSVGLLYVTMHARPFLWKPGFPGSCSTFYQMHIHYTHGQWCRRSRSKSAVSSLDPLRSTGFTSGATTRRRAPTLLQDQTPGKRP